MVQFQKGSLVRGHYKELHKGLELSVECSKTPSISDQFREDSICFSSPLSPNPSLFFSFGGVLRLQYRKKIVFHSPNLPTSSVEIASRPGCHNRPDSTRTRHPHREGHFLHQISWIIFPPRLLKLTQKESTTSLEWPQMDRWNKSFFTKSRFSFSAFSIIKIINVFEDKTLLWWRLRGACGIHGAFSASNHVCAFLKRPNIYQRTLEILNTKGSVWRCKWEQCLKREEPGCPVKSTGSVFDPPH